MLMLSMTLTGVLFAGNAKSAPEQSNQQKKQNVCYTESVEVAKGTSFPVKVYVNNVDSLAGMQVPIYYRSEDVDIKCDSVSFAGSRCGYFAMNDSKIEPVGKTVLFCFIVEIDPGKPEPPLGPGDGVVATLWFTAPKNVNSGKVQLYSGPNAFFPHEIIDFSFLFWNPLANPVDFTYEPGYITVK